MTVHVVGPREVHKLPKDMLCVNTTSHAKDGWQQGLSPFFLGPIPLYGGREARRMENAWQYAKVYPQHLGPDGEPSEAYWEWANAGWANSRPQRYPMGKGAKPAYSFWDGKHLDYIDARLQVYFPLYRNAVAQSPAFAQLKEIYARSGEIALFDFDGYDHVRMGMTLQDVMLYPHRPMGHAFILKMMLLYWEDVTPADVGESEIPAVALKPQASLF